MQTSTGINAITINPAWVVENVKFWLNDVSATVCQWQNCEGVPTVDWTRLEYFQHSWREQLGNHSSHEQNHNSTYCITNTSRHMFRL